MSELSKHDWNNVYYSLKRYEQCFPNTFVNYDMDKTLVKVTKIKLGLDKP